MGVLLALLVGVVGFFAVPASPALADEHPQLEVRINAVSPALIDPTDEGQLVTITGTVTNTSARDMRYVNVHFWRSRQPLTGLDEINDAVSAPLSSPLGSRLDSLESGNLDLLAAEDPFPPGETANFTVQATVAQLELPTVSDAVYRLGVHVRAIPNGDSNTTVGRARVLVPASPLDLPVSATVLLSSRPVAHADGDPINQQESARLLSELTGRLETLLAAAERPNVVGIIDPELYRTVGILAEGNDEAPPNEAAQRWLQRVDRLAAENRLWRLPAGDPHLARADAVGLLDQVLSDTDGGALSAIPLAAVLGETGSEDLAERLTDVDHLVARHAQGVSRRVMEGRAPRVPPALADGTDAEHRGYLLATELLPGTPVNYLLATEEQVTQERLLDGYREHIAPPRYARLTPTWSRALPAPRWTGLADELAVLMLNRELTAPDAAPLDPTAFNRYFTTEEEAIAWMESSPEASVDPRKITVRSAQQFVLSSSTGTLPITITNETAAPVTAQLRFHSDTPQRISIPDSELVTLQPGQSQTLAITPQASANGVTLVHAQLATASGETFGTPVTMEITATQFGRVGWIIIVISGAVVLGGTALRIKAVRSEESNESSQ